MNRRAWRATVHGIAKELDMTQQLNTSNQQSVLVKVMLNAITDSPWSLNILTQ